MMWLPLAWLITGHITWLWFVAGHLQNPDLIPADVPLWEPLVYFSGLMFLSWLLGAIPLVALQLSASPRGGAA